MFADIFSKSFYGNTISQWLISIALIIASVLLAKTAYWAIGTFVKKVTRSSENKLDDLLIDKLDEPIVFTIIIIGIWNSLLLLNLSDAAQGIVNSAYYILIIFVVTWVISRLFDSIINKRIKPLVKGTESQLDDQLLPIVRKGIKIAIWTVATLVALNNAGYNVSAILASLGIGGLAFALAAKDTIANLFGSFTIFVDKPFMIGDRVIVKGHDGVVREIGIRSTRIQTPDGRLVTIPNSQVADQPIVNVSSEPSRKTKLNLGMSYSMSDIQIRQAMDILQDIAINNPHAENNIITEFTEFNESSLNIQLTYYIKKGSSIAGTQTDINLEVLRLFNEQNLEFAFPTRTIYTK